MLNRIFLVGFMGCGKSTIGKKLQEETGLVFVDTDSYIEKEELMSISEIFEKKGEAHFRHLETVTLENMSGEIISTGGGIIEKSENVAIMKKRGSIVFLDTNFAEISRRLEGDQSRPLWKQGIDAKRDLFERREVKYKAAADYIIDTNGKSVTDIVAELRTVLNATNE